MIPFLVSFAAVRSRSLVFTEEFGAWSRPLPKRGGRVVASRGRKRACWGLLLQ